MSIVMSVLIKMITVFLVPALFIGAMYGLDESTKANNDVPNIYIACESKIKTCQCAVFNSKAPSETDLPILIQTALGVNYDVFGEAECQTICTTLALEAKQHGPDLLCINLRHITDLQASVHSRVCGAKKWTYTGLTCPQKICCHEYKSIDCKDQLPAPTDLNDPQELKN